MNKYEPFVNHALMDRVLEIKERENASTLILESINITDTWKKAMSMTVEELIVCVIAALQVCPNMVYAALADDREELVRKGEHNGQQDVD